MYNNHIMSLDQFYTKEDIAANYYVQLQTIVNVGDFDVILEPSAGKGSFFKLLPHSKRKGIDVEPKCPDIEQMDYFNFNPEQNKKYLVIGNPPFGRISSIAVKFFNKSATFADCIAFIIPRTFKRVSIQNKLSLDFKLVHSEDLPMEPCCFEPKMSAKCCFQIWTRASPQRQKVIYDKTHEDFTFLKHGSKDANNQPTPPLGADFVMKAYGSNCGEIVEQELQKLRPKSWHWIKSNIDANLLKERFNTLDYSMSKDTVRQDSIGRQEVIYLYKMKYN